MTPGSIGLLSIGTVPVDTRAFSAFILGGKKWKALFTLGLAALLGLIPANIAKRKGHSFGLWWFYGWMLFIVAIIHVQFIEDYNAPEKEMKVVATLTPSGSFASTADEIMKYKELLDQGVLTQEEFERKKQQLLK